VENTEREGEGERRFGNVRTTGREDGVLPLLFSLSLEERVLLSSLKMYPRQRAKSPFASNCFASPIYGCSEPKLLLPAGPERGDQVAIVMTRAMSLSGRCPPGFPRFPSRSVSFSFFYRSDKRRGLITWRKSSLEGGGEGQSPTHRQIL